MEVSDDEIRSHVSGQVGVCIFLKSLGYKFANQNLRSTIQIFFFFLPSVSSLCISASSCTHAHRHGGQVKTRYDPFQLIKDRKAIAISKGQMIWVAKYLMMRINHQF